MPGAVMRGATTLGWVGLAVVGCGGTPASTTTATVAHNAGPQEAPVAPWVCPAGDELSADLDGDGRLDRVRLAPTAAEVGCLEIHASTAPALVCNDPEGRFIPSFEVDHGQPQETGVIRCDPSDAAVKLVTRPSRSRSPSPGATDPDGLPPGRRFELALLGRAAPTGVAVWLDGGDASAAITWLDGRWAWVELGF